MDINPMEFIFSLFDKFQGFADACEQILYTRIGLGSLSITVWEFIGGTAVVTLFVIFVIKIFF